MEALPVKLVRTPSDGCGRAPASPRCSSDFAVDIRRPTAQRLRLEESSRLSWTSRREKLSHSSSCGNSQSMSMPSKEYPGTAFLGYFGRAFASAVRWRYCCQRCPPAPVRLWVYRCPQLGLPRTRAWQSVKRQRKPPVCRPSPSRHRCLKSKKSRGRDALPVRFQCCGSILRQRRNGQVSTQLHRNIGRLCACG